MDKLRNALENVLFDWDRSTFPPAVRLGEIPGWDSSATVDLLMALEVNHGVSLQGVQLRDAQMIGELADLLRSRGGRVA